MAVYLFFDHESKFCSTFRHVTYFRISQILDKDWNQVRYLG